MDEAARRRGYWKWTKEDFLPGDSFGSWASYGSSLLKTPLRFADRLLGRSADAAELGHVRAESAHPMSRCLSRWDLTWLGLGSVVGAGVFVLTGQEAHDHAGPSVVLAYAAAGASATLSALCLAEFAVEIPVAGGAFAYLRVELGDFVAFLAAANLLLKSVVGSAAVARSWTSYLATLLDRSPNSLRIPTRLAEGFNLLDPIALSVLVATSAVAVTSTRRASLLNWIASTVHLSIMAFVVVAGLAHADARNLSPFLPHGPQGLFRATAVVYFAYGGFDVMVTMAEEMRDPSRDIPAGLLASMGIITLLYCLMALSLVLMERYTAIDPNAAFPAAFQNAGMGWAQRVVAMGALVGMAKVLLVGGIGKARYATHIARAHVVPPLFALVHPTTGTPVYATLLITVAGAALAFFSSLSVLASQVSLSTLFIFTLIPAALLVRRYHATGASTRASRAKLITCLSIIAFSSIGTSVYWGLNPDGWIGYAITIPMWAAGTLGIQLFVPQLRPPRVWGAPLVPWLPSLSIAINVFLMGSLGSEAFVRFGFCMGVMLVYYVFYGVHATFDMAHGLCDNKNVMVEGEGNEEARRKGPEKIENDQIH
uniref:Cationic amino acid transporter C-terminal domain-containing protein n=1 Tax=Ananas comosus var. bracteatus TaxID=296719 RepID=A0A6V7QHF1_ANACO|nr:unnamed protein product [Ananas comosus var. bracteatus]